MPRPVALGRTSVAPAPSPNSTAVVRSLQSMMDVSLSDATTSTCRACSLATSPSATLRAYRKPVQAAPTSNAAACLAPSRAWRSHAWEGRSRSGEQVARTTASRSSGVSPVCSSTCSAAALAMQAFDSSGPATRRSRMPVRSRIHWSDVSSRVENSSFVMTRLGVYRPVATSSANGRFIGRRRPRRAPPRCPDRGGSSPSGPRRAPRS